MGNSVDGVVMDDHERPVSECMHVAFEDHTWMLTDGGAGGGERVLGCADLAHPVHGCHRVVEVVDRGTGDGAHREGGECSDSRHAYTR